MNDFTLGRHDAAIASLAHEMKLVRSDLAEIKVYMSERQGERRAAMWIASTASAIVGALFTVGFKVADFFLSRLS